MKKGFSTLELVISFIIIAIIVAATTVVISKNTNNGKVQAFNNIINGADNCADPKYYPDGLGVIKNTPEGGIASSLSNIDPDKNYCEVCRVNRQFNKKSKCMLCKLKNLKGKNNQKTGSKNIAGLYVDVEKCKYINCHDFDTKEQNTKGKDCNDNACCMQCGAKNCISSTPGSEIETSLSAEKLDPRQPNPDATNKSFYGYVKICKAGTSSPGGNKPCTSCKPGNYQDELRQAQCKNCEKGYYCCKNSLNEKKNLISSDTKTVNENCPGATEQTPCPPGYYCPDPDEWLPTACTAGNYCCSKKYENGVTNYNEKTCQGVTKEQPCPENHYCPGPETPTSDTPNPPGTWKPQACPANSTSTVGSKSINECKCDKGYYRTDVKKDANGNIISFKCTECPVDHYCPDPNSEIPTECPEQTPTTNGKTQRTNVNECYPLCPDKLELSSDKYLFINTGKDSSGICDTGFYITRYNFNDNGIGNVSNTNINKKNTTMACGPGTKYYQSDNEWCYKVNDNLKYDSNSCWVGVTAYIGEKTVNGVHYISQSGASNYICPSSSACNRTVCTFNAAKTACSSLGKEWSLPTSTQLLLASDKNNYLNMNLCSGNSTGVLPMCRTTSHCDGTYDGTCQPNGIWTSEGYVYWADNTPKVPTMKLEVNEGNFQDEQGKPRSVRCVRDAYPEY